MEYIRLIRIKHWIKNGLIFFPLFFSKNIFNIKLLHISILGFLSFAFITSAVYVINDIKDIEIDKRNINKCKRPIASGVINVSTAKMVMLIMVLLGLITYSFMFKISYSRNTLLGGMVLIIYFFQNIVYSFGAKNIPIVDVILLSLGFVLRVFYGSAITGISTSAWLYLVILSASLYLALGKRLGEMKNVENIDCIDKREVLKSYNEVFLTSYMNVSITLLFVFYSLWCKEFAEVNENMMYTIPLLIFLFMRYGLIVQDNKYDGDPVSILWGDKWLAVLSMVFMISVFLNLYINL